MFLLFFSGGEFCFRSFSYEWLEHRESRVRNMRRIDVQLKVVSILIPFDVLAFIYLQNFMFL